jgi:radical SAM protein with 4Fe4S-binding SPASM domain
MVELNLYAVLDNPAPKLVAVELTNICNLKCSVCWSQTPKLNLPRNRGYMSEQLFQKVMAELAEAPKDHIVALSYAGESTLHSCFAEYSRVAHNCGFDKLQLATNGTILTAEVRKTILECYTEVAVSIHNSPYYNQVLDNLIQLDLENRAAGKPVELRANIVCDEFTQAEYYHLTTKLRKNRITNKTVNAITEDMQGIGYGSSLVYPACAEMYAYLAVLWNGDTLPCCHLLSPGNWSLGNINEQTINQVFYGKKYNALRAGEQTGTPCLKCNLRR